MTASPAAMPDIEARIARYLTAQGLMPRVTRIDALTPDASDRRYFRVSLDDGRSMVLAVYATPIELAAQPFASVAALFARIPLPIPAILGHSDEDGVIAQSDLGDVTLQAHVGGAIAANERLRLYREAVDLIALLQKHGAELASEQYSPYRLAFDVEKLTWEMEFFVRHFLAAYRGATLSASEREALGTEWAALTSELAAEPRVVCHRDYHSRNLMVVEGHLAIIDFQDARMGPDTYDLVSLLRDSYVELTQEESDGLMEHFLESAGADAAARADFPRRFDVMAMQRNLKALGTFGYQATSRHNPVYAQYIPRTLEYVRRNFERNARFARLRGLLTAHVPELA